MTDIATLMESAVDKVKTATLLDSRAGLAAGGQAADPKMRRAPLPCAWVIYAGDANTSTEPRAIGSVTDVQHEIIVKVLTAYNTEQSLKTVSYPTLQDVINSMTTEPVSTSGTCEHFKYEGQTLEELDDRIVYIHRYSISGNL